jgi:hypothetical protein
VKENKKHAEWSNLKLETVYEIIHGAYDQRVERRMEIEQVVVWLIKRQESFRRHPLRAIKSPTRNKKRLIIHLISIHQAMGS